MSVHGADPASTFYGSKDPGEETGPWPTLENMLTQLLGREGTEAVLEFTAENPLLSAGIIIFIIILPVFLANMGRCCGGNGAPDQCDVTVDLKMVRRKLKSMAQAKRTEAEKLVRQMERTAAANKVDNSYVPDSLKQAAALRESALRYNNVAARMQQVIDALKALQGKPMPPNMAAAVLPLHRYCAGGALQGSIEEVDQALRTYDDRYSAIGIVPYEHEPQREHGDYLLMLQAYVQAVESQQPPSLPMVPLSSEEELMQRLRAGSLPQLDDLQRRYIEFRRRFGLSG